MSTADPTILFLYDGLASPPRRIGYQAAARSAGLQVFVAGWRDVRPTDGAVTIETGYRLPSSEEKVGIAGESIRPDIVLHRKLIWGFSEALVDRLSAAPGRWLSYHWGWKPIGQKWRFEECFRAAERAGLRIPRPRTYLIEKARIPEELSGAGRAGPLIFKPADGSMCRGIVLSCPADFDRVAAAVARSDCPQYVVQELIEEGLLYRGRRFDLRLYALVTSFRPLRWTLLHEGVARPAAGAFDPARPAEPLGVLTGCSYRRRRGVSTENLTVTHLLAFLRTQGVAVADFWDEAERVLTAVFRAFADHGPLAGADLSRRFYLAGVDLLMVPRGPRFSLLFLETNYVPDLTGWGTGVDLGLEPAYRDGFAELRAAVTAGPA